MKNKTTRMSVALLTLLLLGVPVLASSPVISPVEEPGPDIVPSDSDNTNCPQGIIEGPDPIGMVSDCDKDSRDKRAQGGPSTATSAPQMGIDPISGRAFLVWPEQNAGERDIVFSAWNGYGWGRVEFLSNTLADERDPRVTALDDGSIFVVWWSDDRGVEVTRRDPQSGVWSDPSVLDASGSHPSVGAVDGVAVVAFESRGNDGRSSVVLARQTGSGELSFSREEVVAVEQPLSDVSFAERDGETRLEWTAGETRWSAEIDAR